MRFSWDFLKIPLATYFVAILTGLEAKVPNILLILADDLGYGDVGCYNPKSKVPTPNLDKLANEGIRFTDAHSPSTVCTPTRYSLLTGRMAFRLNYRGVFTGVGGPCLIASVKFNTRQSSEATRLQYCDVW